MSQVLAGPASRSFRIIFVALLSSFLLALICGGCAAGMGAASGNQSSDQISIQVMSPASGAALQGSVSVSVQVTATSPVTNVTMALDSANVGHWSSANVQTTINASPGQHQLSVNAIDQSGGSAQKTVSFSVSAGAAGLNVLWPANGASLPSPVFINATLSDKNPGSTISLSADGLHIGSASGAMLQTYVPLAPGQHTLVISSNDSAGVRQQQTINISVPITRYVLVMNDDATVSSFAFNIATGQLVPQGYLSLSSGGANITDGMVKDISGSLEGFTDCDGQLANVSVQGFSWAPQLTTAAVATTGRNCFNGGGQVAVYESAAGGSHIRGFASDGAGSFTELQNSPFTAAGGSANPIASPMALTPSGRFGYLANPASRTVETFSIDNSGNLLSKGLTPARLDAAYNQIDPTGQLLYVTSSDSNLLTIFQVNQNTGALKMAGAPFLISQNGAPKIVSTGRYLYVQDQGQNPINIYRADALTGTLQPLGQTSAAYQLLGADASGHFLFAALQNDFSGEKQNLLMILQISQTDGTLTEINSTRLRGTDLPKSIVAGVGAGPVNWGINKIVVGFAGQSGNPDQVIQYSADPNRGVINANGSDQMPVGEHVSSIAVASQVIAEVVDQNGNGIIWSPRSCCSPISAPSADRLSASANHQNGYFKGCLQCGNDQWNIAYWSWDANQNSSTTQYSAATLTGLTTLAADPLDQFLFASIDQNGSVFNESFLLDRNTGAPALQNVDWITFDPAYVQVVDPTGKTALSIDPNNGNVAVTYRIEADGNMDWMYVSSFSGTRGIFDLTGKYVIAVNAIGALDQEQGPGKIYVYQLGDDGSLTAVGGPYLTPHTPRDFAIDASGKFLYVVNGGAVSIFNFDERTGTMQESPFSPETIAPATAPVATAIAIQNQKN